MEQVKPREYRQRGIDFHRTGDIPRAVECYRRYLAALPEDAGIWSNLGAALRKLKLYSTAVGCYQESLRLEPETAGTLSNLGNTYTDLNRLEEALYCHRESLEREPANRQFRFNLAVALRETKKFPEALNQVKILLEDEPDSPRYLLEQAINQLYLGDYSQGWQNYEIRWESGKLKLPALPLPRWRGEDLKGKRLLLLSEQGYGDTLLAARNIPALAERGGKISLLCKKEIMPVLSRLPLEEIRDIRSTPPESLTNAFDFFCPLMSVFGILGIDNTNIPAPAPISVPEDSRSRFTDIPRNFAHHFKVGMVWSGSLTFEDNDKRSADFEWFLELSEIPGVKLFSFQKGPRAEDLRDHQALPLVNNIAPQLENFGDTAAALEQMDLIIMTDSSVAHLAGSLGKPVWNLLQYKPYWIYFPEKETTDWYPSMRLFRQRTPGDWAPVFRDVHLALKKIVAKKRPG